MEKPVSSQIRKETVSKLREIMPSGTPTVMTTEILSGLLGVKAQTLRRGISQNGHYLGLCPLKLPNGRLIWSINE